MRFDLMALIIPCLAWNTLDLNKNPAHLAYFTTNHANYNNVSYAFAHKKSLSHNMFCISVLSLGDNLTVLSTPSQGTNACDDTEPYVGGTKRDYQKKPIYRS